VDLSEYMLEPLTVQPIVFVVHNDTSVRESLESLIRCEGWQSETFAFAREFLALSGTSMDLIFKEGSSSNAPTRRLYLSPATAMCPHPFKP
jgi:hypothetical protein